MKISKNKYYIILGILLVIQIIRCFSGAQAYIDEQHYISLAYRFANGSRMFVDEIGIAQMMGFILMPIVKLYLILFNTTDGIFLYVRLWYVVMSFISALLIYHRFKNESNYAWFASIISFIFVPFSIMSLSYNSMAINFMIQSICLFDLKNKSFIKSMVSGILFSFVVICNPYMASFYLFSTIYILIDKNKISKEIVSNYLYSFIGICLIAILFLLFVFYGANIEEILNSFKYMVDPTHSASLIKKILGTLNQFRVSFNYFILLEGVIAIGLCFKYNNKVDLFNKILCVLCIIYYFIFSRERINAGGYSVIFMPIVLAYLYNFKNLKNINKVYFWIVMFESLCFLFSSNVGARAISNILINALVIIIVSCFDNENIYNLNKIIFIVTFISLFICRLIFDNGLMVTYEKEFDKGPFKYLYGSNEFYETYIDELEEFEYINKLKEGDNIYITSEYPWIFLNFENKNIINFSVYQYYGNKKDYLNMFKEYMSYKSYSDYYLYVIENEFGITIDDLNVNAVFVKQFKYGDLYLVKN